MCCKFSSWCDMESMHTVRWALLETAVAILSMPEEATIVRDGKNAIEWMFDEARRVGFNMLRLFGHGVEPETQLQRSPGKKCCSLTIKSHVWALKAKIHRYLCLFGLQVNILLSVGICASIQPNVWSWGSREHHVSFLDPNSSHHFPVVCYNLLMFELSFSSRLKYHSNVLP